jgi:hypothetical protein
MKEDREEGHASFNDLSNDLLQLNIFTYISPPELVQLSVVSSSSNVNNQNISFGLLASLWYSTTHFIKVGNLSLLVNFIKNI